MGGNKMNIRRLEISVLTAFIILVLAGQINGSEKNWANIRENTLRLHIPANSNSEIDQRAKIHIRDFILENFGEELTETKGAKEAKIKTESEIKEIENAVNEELERMNMPYGCNAKIVNMFFDTTYYEDFTMAAGNYDALRVELGKAKGRNWWCVMYPPMCLGTSLDKTIPDEENIINENSSFNFTPKFAIIEIFQKIKNKCKK